MWTRGRLSGRTLASQVKSGRRASEDGRRGQLLPLSLAPKFTAAAESVSLDATKAGLHMTFHLETLGDFRVHTFRWNANSGEQTLENIELLAEGIDLFA